MLGTVHANCSETFQKQFSEVDLIVSKGQVKFKMLSDLKEKIFFRFKVKCSVVADPVECLVGTQVLFHYGEVGL